MHATSGRRRGTVVSFDDAGGHGAVADAGGAPMFFHCTAIADGSRTIAVGTSVEWVERAGHHGRMEAADVRATGVSSGFACPVCTSPITGDPRSYEICDRCGWEDDPAQFDDPSYTGGANTLSLNDARTAWVAQSRT